MYDWESHVPVELRRRGRPGVDWSEHQHPRDGEGKFTRRGRDVSRVNKFGAKLAEYDGAKQRYDRDGPSGVQFEDDPGPPPIAHLSPDEQFDWLEEHGDAQADAWDRNKWRGREYGWKLENDPEFAALEDRKARDEIIVGGGRPTPGRRTRAAQSRLQQGRAGYRRRRGKAAGRAAGAGAVAAGALGLAYAGGKNDRAARLIQNAGQRVGKRGDQPWQ